MKNLKITKRVRKGLYISLGLILLGCIFSLTSSVAIGFGCFVLIIADSLADNISFKFKYRIFEDFYFRDSVIP